MKRTAALAVFAIVLSMGVTAFADSPLVAYTGGEENAATVTGTDGYCTVLIQNSNADIVYVNQADSAFSGVMNFFLQSAPETGTYTARFGGSGSVITKSFYIGVGAQKTNDVPMTRLSSIQNVEDNTYSSGFYTTLKGTDYNSLNSIKVGYMNEQATTVYGGFDLKSGGYPTTQFSGEGSLTLLFELDDITDKELESVSVFLSTDQVGDRKAYQE